MSGNRTLAILNLAGEFPTELANYFASREIQVINPLIDSTKLEWTHIFTKDVADYSVIDATYEAIKNDIVIVSLSKVVDLQDFVLNNGKMVFDEQWLTGSMGGFILDKFFQEYAGISLEDNFPNFKEIGSFKIANPFSTGEYLDRMVFEAFEKNISGLSIKTYFDHLLMYLAGLKNKGRVGLPIEISYGMMNEVFGVQMHFFAQNLTMDDVTMSLSASFAKRPEEYLLNVAIQSAEFFDFTMLSGVNKIVITGLWTAENTVKIENRSLMFTNLSPSARISAYPTQAADSFVIKDGEIGDMTAKINIPDREEEIPEMEVTPAEVIEEHLTVIGPSSPEEEVVTTVGGGEEEDDFSKVVKGSNKEKDNFVTKLGGNKEEKDNFSMKIGGGETDDGKGKFNMKSLGGGSSSKDNANSFFKNIPSEKEKELEEQLRSAFNDNERLKTKVKILASEVENVKNTKNKMNELKARAEEVEGLKVKSLSPDDELKKQMQHKLSESRQLSPQEMAKLNSLLERETKFIEEAKHNEIKLKKLQLELLQKDMVFTQELEKAQRSSTSKDIVLVKAKEAMVRVTEKKDAEIQSLRDRFDQVNKVLASSPNQVLQTTIKDLEKQNINLNKMLEVYKNKVTSLATAIESTKGDDGSFKDEARRLGMMTTTLKNQADSAKKDLDKLKEKNTQDTILIGGLRQEKLKLESMLKRASQEAPKAQVNLNVQVENDLLKFKQQAQGQEVQIREMSMKMRDMERRLAEAVKNTRTNTSALDENPKAKVSHLEASLKKITGDLMAAQNQTGEMKKETNKLRSENQSLQNQLAQTKKELEKLKPATPKKPGEGGKAA